MDRDVSADIAVIRAQMTAMSETQARIESDLIDKIDSLDEKVDELSHNQNVIAVEIAEIKTAQGACTAGAKIEKTEKDVTELKTTVSNMKWVTGIIVTLLAAAMGALQFFRGGT